MKELKVRAFRLDSGKHCFMSRGKLCKYLAKQYGRSPEEIILKIFDLEEVNSVDDLKKCKWGDDPKDGGPRKNSRIWDASQIQNIAAMHGLAPRVYGLETVNVGGKLRPVQVLERLNGEDTPIEEAEKVYAQVVELGKEYGFGIEKEDVSEADIIDGKLVDFQTFAFTTEYFETVKKIYIEKGRYGKVYYQNQPLLELRGGPRKSELRIKELGLDSTDLNFELAVDIGCAGGFFCNYLRKRGIRRMIGIDLDTTAAQHLSNLLGYWNVDYYAHDLSKGLPVALQGVKIDLMLLLSMNYHIGLPDWIQQASMVIFEDNGKQSREENKLIEPLSTWFPNSEFLGNNSDHGGKPIYHLKK